MKEYLVYTRLTIGSLLCLHWRRVTSTLIDVVKIEICMITLIPIWIFSTPAINIRTNNIEYSSNSIVEKEVVTHLLEIA